MTNMRRKRDLQKIRKFGSRHTEVRVESTQSQRRTPEPVDQLSWFFLVSKMFCPVFLSYVLYYVLPEESNLRRSNFDQNSGY